MVAAIAFSKVCVARYSFKAPFLTKISILDLRSEDDTPSRLGRKFRPTPRSPIPSAALSPVIPCAIIRTKLNRPGCGENRRLWRSSVSRIEGKIL